MTPEASPTSLPRPLVIRGTGSALPRRILTSGEINRSLGRPEGWSERQTGVTARHIAGDEDQIDLAVSAAERAIADAGIDRGTIDVILFAAAVGYQSIPATAPLIQRRLGIGDGAIAAFDINATCLGFLVALDLLAGMLACGRYRCGLIVSSEIASRGLPWAEAPEVAALFGDGAAAAVVTGGSEGGRVVACRLESYPSAYEACSLGAGGTRYDFHADPDAFAAQTRFAMDGKALYRHTLQHFDGFLDRLLQEAGWRREEVDLVVPHQASPGALRHLASRCGFGEDRIIDIVGTLGNQIAASLPTALDMARRGGRLPSGSRTLFLGTAAGLTLGGMAWIA